MQQIDEMKDWKRGEILGRGGYASVYLATAGPNHPFLPPVSAVKSAPMIKPGGGTGPSPASWLVREGHILDDLQGCPHIIGFYGSSVSDDHKLFYLFLEFATMGSLEDRIRMKRVTGTGLPESEVIHYTRSLLHGLAHIHHKKYVHCDIKPNNILLHSPFFTDDYHAVTPKIADFGLAKLVGEPVHKCGSQQWGTLSYMAPESICYDQFEPPADIWALGCVVLKMLIGNTPLSRVLGCHDLPTIGSKFSAEAQHFLSKCLVKEPAFRWTADMLLTHPFLSTDQNIKEKEVPKDIPQAATMRVFWPPTTPDSLPLPHHSLVLDSKKSRAWTDEMPDDVDDNGATSTSPSTMLNLGNCYRARFTVDIDRNKSFRGKKRERLEHEMAVVDDDDDDGDGPSTLLTLSNQPCKVKKRGRLEHETNDASTEDIAQEVRKR